MRLRHVIVLALAFALLVPTYAQAKVLASVRTKTESNPSVSTSGFLRFPKDFRVRIDASKNMKVDGSIVRVLCNKGNDSNTKFVRVKGKPRINKKIKPTPKHATACFLTLSILGDRPGRLRVKLTGSKRPTPETTTAPETVAPQ